MTDAELAELKGWQAQQRQTTDNLHKRIRELEAQLAETDIGVAQVKLRTTKQDLIDRMLTDLPNELVTAMELNITANVVKTLTSPEAMAQVVAEASKTHLQGAVMSEAQKVLENGLPASLKALVAQVVVAQLRHELKRVVAKLGLLGTTGAEPMFGLEPELSPEVKALVKEGKL